MLQPRVPQLGPDIATARFVAPAGTWIFRYCHVPEAENVSDWPAPLCRLGVEGSGSPDGLTAMDWVFVFVPPWPSLTVSAMEYVPAAAYVWLAVTPVPVAPSPKVQLYVSASPGPPPCSGGPGAGRSSSCRVRTRGPAPGGPGRGVSPCWARRGSCSRR